MIGQHAALIYTMVLCSVADEDMSDRELHAIGEIIDYLPVFRGFDRGQLNDIAEACADLLGEEDGIDAALGLIAAGLPARLRETAYALACDVIAADAQATQEELRMLELLQDKLEIDRLTAAAIERGARARFMRG